MTSSNTSIGGTGTQVQNQMPDTMGPNGTAGTSAQDLQQTFLQLLVTQLQNQDPTAPMDSSQMTSQLAQIDTVSGIAQLNQSLTSLSSQLSASQTGQAASLIGHTVLTPGNTFTVGNLTNSDGTPSAQEATSPFGVSLAADATDLQITIKNAQGVVVNTVNVGAVPAGTLPITSFNPVDTNGNPLPLGNYTFTVQDVGGNTANTAPVALTGMTVNSVVQQADGTPGLLLANGKTIPLNGGFAALL